ncbi:MAG: substrate-binding domain-containing protein [Patulibacter sp.]
MRHLEAVNGALRAVVAIAAVAAIAGCGASETTSTNAGAGGDVTAAQQRVEQATGTLTAKLPDAKVDAGSRKTVAVVACNRVQPGCNQPAVGAVEALKAAGWDAKLIDGQGTSDKQNAAIRQALTLKPDGIILSAIDPRTVQQALASAREQGVKVVTLATLDSDLVDAPSSPTVDVYTETGTLLADFAIARSEGAVKALVLHDSGFDILQPRFEGFVSRLKECESCEVLETQAFTSADLAGGVPRLVQQMVQRHPDFNVIYVDYDDAVPPLLQALRSTGRADEVQVLSSNGTVDATTCIAKQCGQDATTAFSLDGIGWAAADQMIRVIAGADLDGATYGIGVKLIDRDVAAKITAADGGGMWDGDSDYRDHYLELWGVK